VFSHSVAGFLSALSRAEMNVAVVHSFILVQQQMLGCVSDSLMTQEESGPYSTSLAAVQMRSSNVVADCLPEINE